MISTLKCSSSWFSPFILNVNCYLPGPGFNKCKLYVFYVLYLYSTWKTCRCREINNLNIHSCFLFKWWTRWYCTAVSALWWTKLAKVSCLSDELKITWCVYQDTYNFCDALRIRLKSHVVLFVLAEVSAKQAVCRVQCHRVRRTMY